MTGRDAGRRTSRRARPSRVLEKVRSVVDVRVYVWQPRAKKWRLLNIAEQKAMWEQRAT